MFARQCVCTWVCLARVHLKALCVRACIHYCTPASVCVHDSVPLCLNPSLVCVCVHLVHLLCVLLGSLPLLYIWAWLDTGGLSVTRVGTGMTAWTSISKGTSTPFVPSIPLYLHQTLSCLPPKPGTFQAHLPQPLSHSWHRQSSPLPAPSSSFSDTGLLQVQAQRQRWQGEGERIGTTKEGAGSR